MPSTVTFQVSAFDKSATASTVCLASKGLGYVESYVLEILFANALSFAMRYLHLNNYSIFVIIMHLAPVCNAPLLAAYKPKLFNVYVLFVSDSMQFVSYSNVFLPDPRGVYFFCNSSYTINPIIDIVLSTVKLILSAFNVIL